MLRNSAIMQTRTIARSVRRTVGLKDMAAVKARQVSTWLNSKSRFYSRVAGFDVTWKTAIMVNIVFVLVVFTALVAAKEPLAALVSAAAAAWMAGRIEKANSKVKKGGRE